MALTTPRKRSEHHKKAAGQHHRQSKHYLKTYHPYLPLLLIVIVGLAINIFWTQRSGVLGATTSLNATQLLTDTNEERATHSKDNLQLDNKLSAAAQSKANDMVAKDYWSHTAPDGTTPWTFIQKSGYDYYEAGENLAYGFANAEDTISGWMNSPEHRANLLNPDYQQVGFGIATAKNFQGKGQTTVIVAMYAEPSFGIEAVVLPTAANTQQPSANIQARKVSRIQILTNGSAAWSSMLVSFVMLAAIAWFLVRHFKIWKRVVRESEEFIVHHKMLDVLIIATAVAGFVLTRTAGFIH